MMKIGYFFIIAVNLKDTLDHIVLLLKTITNRSQCLQGTIILAHAANRMEKEIYVMEWYSCPFEFAFQQFNSQSL